MASKDIPQPFFPPEKPPTGTRRAFLYGSGALVAAGGLYAVSPPETRKFIRETVVKAVLNSEPIVIGGKDTTRTPPPIVSPTINTLSGIKEAPGHVTPEIFTLHVPEGAKPTLNAIAALPLNSEKRTTAEQHLAQGVNHLNEIRAAFVVTTDPLSRKLLQTKYFIEINNQNPGFPLPKDVKAWGKENLVDKEGRSYHDIGLTLLRKDYRAARTVLDGLIQKWHAAGKLPGGITSAMIMPSPGLAAMIIGRESSMLVGIGRLPAIKEIDKDRFKDIEKNLVDTVKNVENATGLKLPIANVPGDTDGALGQNQVMPFRAVEIYDELSPLGIKYNPFDVEQAYLPIMVLLAKTGYQAGKENRKKNMEALKAWTRFEEYRSLLLDVDESYRAAFPHEVK